MWMRSLAACKVGRSTLDDAMPYIWQFVDAMSAALAFITFIPQLGLQIPNAFMR